MADASTACATPTPEANPAENSLRTTTSTREAADLAAAAAARARFLSLTRTTTTGGSLMEAELTLDMVTGKVEAKAADTGHHRKRTENEAAAGEASRL